MSLFLYPEAMEKQRKATFDYFKSKGKTLNRGELEVACFAALPIGHKLKGEFNISLTQMRWSDLYLEKDGYENYWFTRILRATCIHRRLFLVGAASAGKTFGLSVSGMNFWGTSPRNTTMLATSTDSESLKSKAWGTILDLHERDLMKIGNRINYEDAIVYNHKAKERDVRDAIKAIALPKGSEGEKAIGKVQGRKNTNIIWLAQPLTSKVLTPYGWSSIGELEEGDRIISSSGKIELISKVHPIHKETIYELTFSDGSKARSSGDHVWTLKTHRGVLHNGSTLFFQRTLKQAHTDTKGRPVYRWSLPPSPVVKYHQKHPLSISPYIIGALIGDGSILNGVAFYCSDEDVAEHFRSELPPDHRLVLDRKRKNCFDYHVSGLRHKNLIISELRRLELMGKGSATKFIPKEYLYASVENRVALLQGLMDADGSVTGSTLRYTTISPQLSKDVTELIRSLGGYADECVGKRKDGGLKFTVVASLPSLGSIIPFRCARKIGRCQGYGRNSSRHRRLVSVEEVGFEDVRCITTTAPDGLYITDDFVLTHNCDEYGHMDPFVKKARSNLRQGCLSFCFWACANKPEEGDPMYEDAAPDPEKFPMGWETPGLDELEGWETVGGGYCLYFDGLKSPNLQAPAGKKDPFPMLTRRDSIEEERKESGEDGYGWWKYVRAFPRAGQTFNKLIDSKFLERYRALEAAIWAEPSWTVICGLDAAWTKGGDSCMAYFGKVGISDEGVKVLETESDAISLNVKVSGRGTFEEQLAVAFLDECQKRNCHSVAIDISGSGGRLANPVRDEAQRRGWKLDMISVDSAGKPTEEEYPVGSIKKKGIHLFDRRVSEIWVGFRLAVQEGWIRGLSLTSKAIRQMSDRRIDSDVEKRYVLEAKDEYKKRHQGKSPDSAEALVLLCVGARQSGLGVDLVKRETTKKKVEISTRERTSTYAWGQPRKAAYNY